MGEKVAAFSGPREYTGEMEKTPQTESEWEARIATLEARLLDLQARFPAHSTSPALIAELDELDEQLEEARQQLRALQNSQRA